MSTRSALSRLTISSPELLDPFADLNAGKAWSERVKPFNYLLVRHVHPFGHPVGVDPTRFQPIAPYESDPSKWAELPWIDRYSGQQFRVGGTDQRGDPEAMHLQGYRDVVREFRTHPEAKSAAADKLACDRRTVGLLLRRVVRETYVANVGKEANKLEEVEVGIERNPEAIYTEYQRPDRDEWALDVLPSLSRVSDLTALARDAGISVRAIYSLRSGGSHPRASTREAITRALHHHQNK